MPKWKRRGKKVRAIEEALYEEAADELNARFYTAFPYVYNPVAQLYCPWLRIEQPVFEDDLRRRADDDEPIRVRTLFYGDDGPYDVRLRHLEGWAIGQYGDLRMEELRIPNRRST